MTATIPVSYTHLDVYKRQVSTAILLFTKTNSGGTDHVWFYDLQADGFSLDDKRNPIEANDLRDVAKRWALRNGSEMGRARTEQSFCVPKAGIVSQGYDLSLNRYKEVVHDEVEMCIRDRAGSSRSRWQACCS